jgi:hypothetical protein
VREGDAKADVMSEEFEPTLGRYRLVLRCRGGPGASREPLRVRFHGQTFSRGRFEVEVKGEAEWKVEFDRPAENGEALPEELVRGRKRFSSPVVAAAPTAPAAAPSPSAPPPPAAEETWRLTGSRGGCTLLVYATPANGVDKSGVVQVSIDRRDERARTTRDRVRLTSRAFGEAERAGEDNYTREPGGSLRAAREVWRALRIAGLADPLAAPAAGLPPAEVASSVEVAH